MKKIFFGLLLLIIIYPVYTQTTIRNTPFPIDDVNHLNGEVVDFGNNEMYALWSRFENTDLVRYFMSKSTDGGETWQAQGVVFERSYFPYTASEDSYAGAQLIKGDNNRLLLFIKAGSNRDTYYKYSDNGGSTWSNNFSLKLHSTTSQSPAHRIFSVLHLGAGNLILTSSNGINSSGTVKSSDNGTTWLNWITLGTPAFLNPSLVSIGDGSFYLAGQQTGTTESKKIFFVKYIASNTWQDTAIVYEDTSAILTLPRLIKSSTNELYVYFTKTSKVFGKYNNSNIYYSKSSDEGATWGTPVRVTYYPGEDNNLNLNSQSKKPFIVFSSRRNAPQGLKQLSWANGLEFQDNSTPPVIYDFKFNIDSVFAGDSLKIRVFTGSQSNVTEIKLSGYFNDLPYTLPLFDDGNHNDSLPGDNIYGNFINIFQEGDFLRFTISMQNAFGMTVTEEYFIGCQVRGLPKTAELKTGRLIVPFNYEGVLGDVFTASGSGIRFDLVPTVFSHGFMLSGRTDSTVWAAGQFSSPRILDFRAGKVGFPANDPRNGIYQVSLTDSAFGTSWQKWKGAVSLGARYWDGNNNNIYDPIDLNQNGTWEINEDMPEILGEVSYFTVFNDKVEPSLRKLLEAPKGVEIRQTLYAFPNADETALRNAVFIRYEITMKENLSPSVENFIFSLHSDPNIGHAYDDLFMTDTLRNSIVCYNDGDDPAFGVNPPAIYNSMLFGTPLFIPGVSFTDLNNNGTFENGIDTPLDTAIIPLGKPFSNLEYPGATNSRVRVSSHYMSFHPTQGNPNTSKEVRNYMIGKNRIGEYINPCTWTYGEVRGGVDCSMVDSVLLYSGDPVEDKGWINNIPVEQITLFASDSTLLNHQTTITYHTAIIMGRGNSAINSIAVTRANVDTIFTKLGVRHNYFPTSLEEPISQLPGVYELYQNYPNPFNPNTLIKFSLPVSSFVKLKIYDNTGALVKTLLNQEMNPGNHEVSFSGTTLASGVYFYRLECDKFTQTRKMILIK